MNSKEIKNTVKEKYGKIARQNSDAAGCCGTTSSCCDDLEFSMIGDDYQSVEGHNAEADLGLGCGVPTEFAGLKVGMHVLDLGSGAGNDCFVARAIVGESGSVTGLDFSPEMIEKARINAQKLSYENMNFVLGDIEEMPFKAEQFDAVISNCVLNLVPDKNKAFAEIMRVLKPGGHFCVSDVVSIGKLPENLRRDAEMYVGCVSGALSKDKYLSIIENTGFESLNIHKQSKINIPSEILSRYLTKDELQVFESGESGVYSLTLSAAKK